MRDKPTPKDVFGEAIAEVAFLFPQKRKRSILLNITFLSASSNITFVILLREKKNCLSSLWEMVPVHEEKIVMHKLLNKHHDVMYKKLSPCALPPAVGWGVPRAHRKTPKAEDRTYVPPRSA